MVMVLVPRLQILFDLIEDVGAHFYTVCLNKLSFMVILMSSFHARLLLRGRHYSRSMWTQTSIQQSNISLWRPG